MAMRSILCRYPISSFPFLSGCCLFLNKPVMVHILTILLVPSTPMPGESSLRDVIGFGWFCGCDVTVCSKGMVQSWWGTWILGVSCLHPLLLMGWPPGRSGQTGQHWAPVLLCSQCLSQPLCFSTALQPPGPLMEPLTKGSCGSQMAQTLLWKAKSSLSFGIQPLQTWPTKDPEAEVEAQVNL